MSRNPLFNRGMVLQRGQVGVGALAPPGPPRGPVQELPAQPDCYGAYSGQGAASAGAAAQNLAGAGCGAQRVQLTGGALNTAMLDPMFIPYELLFRSLPEEGMFDAAVSPERPFAWEIGSFRAEKTMAIAIFDLRPDIYRFSGIDPGDYVPVAERRFSSVMGFDISNDQRRSMGNIQYQLDPQPIQFAGTGAFRPTEGSTDLFTTIDLSTASSFAAAAGGGTAVQPQRPTRFGAPSIPFMMVARPGETIQIRCVIFHPVPSPIAFVEYNVAGLLIPDKTLQEYLECMRPRTEMSR